MTCRASITRVLLAIALTAAAQPGSAHLFDVEVLAPDGTALATDVYFPFGSGPWPVVLMRTPYDKSALAAVCVPLNLYGLACVAQDMRGMNASGGDSDSVFREDGPDGRATVEWITDQEWCDGNIATWGGSALGITQYALVPGAAAELRSIMPAAATPDIFHHGFFQGGCMRESLTVNWLEQVGMEAYLEVMLEHRLWDDWWAEVDVLSRADEVTAPGLHLGGWYDIFLQGAIDGYTAFQHRGGDGAAGSQYLVIGPWTHATFGQGSSGQLDYPANAILDVLSLSWDWIRYWASGDDTGVDKWPRVSVYVMGAVGELGAPGNQWLDLDDWPPPAVRLPFHLQEDGSLTRATPAAGELELLIDPADPVPTLGGANLYPSLEVAGRAMGAGPHDQGEVEKRTDVLEFTTAPLTQPLTVIGPLQARLWIVPDTPDLDLSVRLCDVYPDGRSMLVIDGVQRARMRCGDDRECLLTPGVPAEIEVDLWSTALVFNTGHRVRVDVAGSNAPRFEVNPNDGTDLDSGTPIVARPRLRFGPDHPSALVLPVVPTPRQPGGRVIGGGALAGLAGRPPITREPPWGSR